MPGSKGGAPDCQKGAQRNKKQRWRDSRHGLRKSRTPKWPGQCPRWCPDLLSTLTLELIAIPIGSVAMLRWEVASPSRGAIVDVVPPLVLPDVRALGVLEPVHDALVQAHLLLVVVRLGLAPLQL